MKIIKEYPPNIEEIKKVFDIEGKPVVFTYGEVLYNPTGGEIPQHLLVHEETHTKQQGDDPAGWWRKYISDQKFRLDQELEAYKKQYKFYCMQTANRNKRFELLQRIARDLSSKVYGNIISFNDAFKLIRN